MTPQEGPVTALASERGAGRAVVFLHGYPLNHSMWTPQLDRLGNSERVVLLDLPGYGSASGSEVPSDLSGFSESVYMALKENSLDRSVIVGHSFGGYVALQLYRDHPGLFEGLVLTNTRSAADTDEARAKRLTTAGRLGVPGGGLDVGVTARSLLAPATIALQPSLVEFVGKIVSAARPQALVPTLLAIAHRPDLTPILPLVRVPTLVMWGEEDHLIPPVESQRMTPMIPDAMEIAIPGAGHLPALESPDLFFSAVQAYLRGLPSPRR